MTKKKKHISLLIPSAIILIGLIMCFAPTVFHLYLSYEAGNNVSSLTSEVSKLDSKEKEELLTQAIAYNQRHAGLEPVIKAEDIWEYERQLSLHGTQAIGVVDIPKASINMTLYHGVDEPALSAGIGHETWSSLPVGGERSHCVISGHSGMRQLRVFDGIRALEKGDLVVLWVLGDPYAYKVDGWEIIDPSDWKYEIKDGVDEITLVTCTTTPDAWNPKGAIGVNDKRLLVHALRCDYVAEDFENIEPDLSVYVNDNTLQAWIAAIALVAGGIIVLIASRRKRKKK